MVEGVEIVPRLMQAFEPPAIELTGEGFVLALHKVSWNDFSNEEFLIVNLPCPTMRLVWDDVIQVPGTMRSIREHNERDHLKQKRTIQEIICIRKRE